jgi:tRNA uridine 5-carboxymethylaminomethyl modification enzyme
MHRIQFRMLNRSKGPAVWSPRAQADKAAYSEYMRGVLENQPGLTILETSIEALIVERDSSGRQRLRGVRTAEGTDITSATLVITTGTFLGAEMHMGCERYGRRAERRAGRPRRCRARS